MEAPAEGLGPFNMADSIEQLAKQLASAVSIHAEAGDHVEAHSGVSSQQSSRYNVGIVYDAVMELHLREDHPEHPNRVRELNSMLEQEGILQRCSKLTPALATNEELLACHSQKHIDKVDQLYHNPLDSDGQTAQQVGDTYIITGDIFCNRHTSTAARSAAGCTVQAVRAVLRGEVRSAFAVVRPPGHHAESEALMGFCFFNNVAVAAHAALQHPGVERVLILDWDVHHGNGTQQIFQSEPRVLVVSLHRRDRDFYPEGCGFAEEVGEGPGAGFNVNVPWPCKGVGDADYLAAFDLVLDPIIRQFDPQLVLISAGFDAAQGDILGKCCVTPGGFAAMTQRLMAHAGGKVVAVLEGGYVPSIVGACSTAVMQVLLGDTPPPLKGPTAHTLHIKTRAALSKVDSIQRSHWPSLAALPPFVARYQQYSNALKLQVLGPDTSPTGHATRGAAKAAAAAAGAAVPSVSVAAAAPVMPGQARRAAEMAARRAARASASSSAGGAAAATGQVAVAAVAEAGLEQAVPVVAAAVAARTSASSSVGVAESLTQAAGQAAGQAAAASGLAEPVVAAAIGAQARGSPGSSFGGLEAASEPSGQLAKQVAVPAAAKAAKPIGKIKIKIKQPAQTAAAAASLAGQPPAARAAAYPAAQPQEATPAAAPAMAGGRVTASAAAAAAAVAAAAAANSASPPAVAAAFALCTPDKAAPHSPGTVAHRASCSTETRTAGADRAAAGAGDEAAVGVHPPGVDTLQAAAEPESQQQAVDVGNAMLVRVVPSSATVPLQFLSLGVSSPQQQQQQPAAGRQHQQAAAASMPSLAAAVQSGQPATAAAGGAAGAPAGRTPVALERVQHAGQATLEQQPANGVHGSVLQDLLAAAAVDLPDDA